MSSERRLSVWLLGERVGLLQQQPSGQLTFAYDGDWLTRRDATALSISLPPRDESYGDRESRPFFAGLLPDDISRRNLARFLQVSERNDFALLELVGGECAGAVALHPVDGDLPTDVERGAVELKTEELAEALRSLPQRPLLAGGELRLSLAGAQDKLAVCVTRGQIALPRGGAPTTHIIKPGIASFSGTVHNELLCLRVAARLGLDVPAASFGCVEDVEYLLVKRYDRKIEPNGGVLRLHQEDFCQALGVPPEMRYQSEGGPSLAQCFDLLRDHGLQPAVDRIALLDAVVFNYLIGNADAHGKNFSVLHAAGGVRLAPRYDLVSTLVYPKLSAKLAMKIGSKYRFNEVLPRHWDAFARAAGLAPALVRRRRLALAKAIPAAVAEAIETLTDAGVSAPVFETIGEIVREHSRRLLAS